MDVDVPDETVRAMLSLDYDAGNGCAYVRLRNDVPWAKTVSLSDLVMVDVGTDGQPIGVEILWGAHRSASV